MKILAGALVLVSAITGLGETLNRVQPKTKEIVVGGHSIDVEEGIQLKVAKAVCGSLPTEVLKDGAMPSIYRVPGFPERYAVVADVPVASDADHGLALYVFEQRGETFRQIFRSKGMGDSYILRPTFFVGHDRTMIMGEIGDESGTWAVYGFEVTKERVAQAGILDAARNDPQQLSWANPIRDARLEFVGGTYVIWLRGEIYLRPEAKDQQKLAGTGWHKFVLEHGRFEHKP